MTYIVKRHWDNIDSKAYKLSAALAISCVFFHLRVLSDEYARHRRGEGGAFPSLFTPLNLKYHERAFVAFLWIKLFSKNRWYIYI